MQLNSSVDAIPLPSGEGREVLIVCTEPGWVGELGAGARTCLPSGEGREALIVCTEPGWVGEAVQGLAPGARTCRPWVFTFEIYCAIIQV